MIRLGVKIAIAAATLAWLVTPAAAAPETCGEFKSCSRAFTANGRCTGQDEIPIIEAAWEDQPITITSVTIGLKLGQNNWWRRILYQRPTGVIFAGNSYIPDLMALQIDQGVTTRTFGPGEMFSLPGKPPSPHHHIDLHLQCTKSSYYEVWLIVYYRLPER
jgi:hypothetical protein